MAGTGGGGPGAAVLLALVLLLVPLGGGAYFGVCAWKNERMESCAGLDVEGRDMVRCVPLGWRRGRLAQRD